MTEKNKPKRTEEVLAELKKKYTDRYVKDEGFRTAVKRVVKPRLTEKLYGGLLQKDTPQNYQRFIGDHLMERYIANRLSMINTSGLNQAQQQMLQQQAQMDLKRYEQARESQELEMQESKTERRKDEVKQVSENAVNQLKEKENQELQEGQNKVNEEARQEMKEALKNSLQQAGYIKNHPTESGVEIKLNDEMIVDRMSDIFLDDILDKLDDRGTGFKALFDYGNFGEDLNERGALTYEGELTRMDPVASKIRARENGRKSLDFEDIVVRKPSLEGIVKAVVCLDRSGSMRGEKFAIAKKTAMALGKCLTKINSDNNVRYVVFDAPPKEVPLSELYKLDTVVDNHDSGALYDALKILEEEKGDVGLVYFITDGISEKWGRTKEGKDVVVGQSESFGYTLQAAEEYSKHPDFYLRYFFINPNDSAKQAVVKVAEAAGKNCRVVPVRTSNLDTAMFSDLEGIFTGIYRAEDFEYYSGES